MLGHTPLHTNPLQCRSIPLLRLLALQPRRQPPHPICDDPISNPASNAFAGRSHNFVRAFSTCHHIQREEMVAVQNDLTRACRKSTRFSSTNWDIPTQGEANPPLPVPHVCPPYYQWEVNTQVTEVTNI
jgi:hypothetical protein